MNSKSYWLVAVLLSTCAIGKKQIDSSDLRRAASFLYPLMSVQPCTPDDSCLNSCIKDSVAPITYENSTIGQLNCFCDKDCVTFGDCCWDYQTECERKVVGKPKSDLSTMLVPRDDAFQCVVVHQFSEESFWMVTKCATNWSDDEISRRCSNISNSDFLSILPVLGNTGWTYRNVFCAQCNYVEQYYYWNIQAHCVRSAPDEVLSGDPEMLSYYILHFCTMEVRQDFKGTISSTTNGDSSTEPSADFQQSLKWRRSVRHCDQNVIGRCPITTTNNLLSSLCQEYQSIVLTKDKSNQHQWIAFKNPFCALCHGYTSDDLDINDAMKPKSSVTETKKRDFSSKCPVWITSNYYDQVFWSLDQSSTESRTLLAFSKNFKTSYWVPPSYSILMNFREDGSTEMTYENKNESVQIPPKQSCDKNQIYDPFYGTCRLVVCANGMVFEGDECIPSPQPSSVASETTTPTSRVNPVLPTVSITVKIPLASDGSVQLANHVAEQVVETFETALNARARNVTVHETTVRHSEEESINGTKDADHDGEVSLTVSCVLVNPDECTNETIVQIVEYINEVAPFEKMLMDADSYRVVVIETNSHNATLECRDGSFKKQYNSTEYELQSFDGRQIVHVFSNDAYYLEDEFQLLDFEIEVTTNATQYGYTEESRVIVCVSVIATDPEELMCAIYLPLNTSEYEVLENQTLWLPQRNILVPPDRYIPFGDSFAVCVDGYTPPPAEQKVTHSSESIFDFTHYVITWISFGLTIFTLAALFITFITYCLFGELRSVAGCNIMNLTLALFVALLTFLIGGNQFESSTACTAITILLHYLFLVTFFWNNVIAYDVWKTFGQERWTKEIVESIKVLDLLPSGFGRVLGRLRLVKPAAINILLMLWNNVWVNFPFSKEKTNCELGRGEIFIFQGIHHTLRRLAVNRSSTHSISRKRLVVMRYMLYGWGAPALLVTICVAIEFGAPQIRFGYRHDPVSTACWITNPTSNIVAFGVPLAIILFINGAFFAASIVALRRVKARAKRRLSGAGIKSTKTPKTKAVSPPPATPEIRSTIVAESENVFTYPEPSGVVAAGRQQTSPSQVQSGSQLRTIAPRCRHSSTSSLSKCKTSMSEAKINVLLYVKMSTLMGFVWAIGFAAAMAETPVLWYIFEISIPLQGVFILIAFICKARIFRLYKNLLCGKKISDSSSQNRVKSGKSNRAFSVVTADNGNHPAVTVRRSAITQPFNFLPVENEEEKRRRSRIYSSSSCDSSRSFHNCCQLPPTPTIFENNQKAIGAAGCVNPAYVQEESHSDDDSRL